MAEERRTILWAPVRPRLPVRVLAILAGTILAALAAAGPGVPSLGLDSKEHRVKAAFLHHFVRFVEWPEESFESEESPIVLLVLGEDPFGKILEDTFRGKRANGRPIRIEREPELDELPHAHLVFVSDSLAPKISEITRFYEPRNGLIVGEAEGIASDGAAVGFYKLKKKVRFAINADAVKRTKLEVSSELLKLARIVRDKKRGADQ